MSSRFEGPHDVFAPLTLAATVGGPRPDDQRGTGFPATRFNWRIRRRPSGPVVGTLLSSVGHAQIRGTDREAVRQFVRSARCADDRVDPGSAFDLHRLGETGERLDFRGEFYRHTLMTPTFNPGPNPFGPPPIYLGALGPRLTRAAASAADGLLVMPFGSAHFMRAVTMPAVHEGLAAAGRSLRTSR